MIAAQLQQRALPMRRLNFGGMIFLTLPFVIVAVFVGLVELALGSDGSAAEFIAKPFIWAYRRKV